MLWELYGHKSSHVRDTDLCFTLWCTNTSRKHTPHTHTNTHEHTRAHTSHNIADVCTFAPRDKSCFTGTDYLSIQLLQTPEAPSIPIYKTERGRGEKESERGRRRETGRMSRRGRRDRGGEEGGREGGRRKEIMRRREETGRERGREGGCIRKDSYQVLQNSFFLACLNVA